MGRHRGIAAAAVLLAASLPGAARALTYDRLFVFGDSLSDTGRTYALTLGAVPPSPPYFDGRFSNGPLWVERLAPLVGTQAEQSSNFAYAGAETGTLSQTGVPGVTGQVSQFALGGPGGRSGGLFAVWGGGNDYIDRVTMTGDPSPLVSQTVGNLVTSVERLAALGGRTFLVPNLPPLGDAPENRGGDRAALLNAVAAAHNAALRLAMTDVEKRLGVKVVVADVAALYQVVTANPTAYGLSNVTTPCLLNNQPTGACGTAAQADASLYWDELHPTTAAHLLIAEFMQASLLAMTDAAETVAVQPELAFATARGWNRALMGSVLGSVPGQQSGERVGQGALTAFLIGDAAWGRQVGTTALAGFRYDTQVGGVGADLEVAPGTRVGLSVGAARGHADLQAVTGPGGAGSLGMTSNIVGLHAATEMGGFHLAAAGSVAFDHYGDIERTTGFALFPQARADTDGRTYTLAAAGGYSAQLGAVTLGPQLGLRYIHSEVYGYGERDAGPVGLNVEGQNAHSLESSVGMAASMQLTLGPAVLEPSLAVAWEHEFSGDGHTVTVHLPGGGDSNSVTSSPPVRNAFVVGGGLSAALGERVTAVLGYRARLAGADGHEHAVTARVRMRF